jgi:hypothetical protein
MNDHDKATRNRWIGGLVGAVVLAGLLAALTTAVISGYTGSSGSRDVVRRTSTPTKTNTPGPTPTDTNTPTITNTPTKTNTPQATSTPTETPTPFPTKSRQGLFDTVMIGGSSGFNVLKTCPGCKTYIPLFDGTTSGFFNEIGHLTLPGAITHLAVALGDGESLSSTTPYTFSLVVNGQKTNTISCVIPSKGKGNFCQDGDKGDCVEVGKQDRIAIQADAKFKGYNPQVHMSWVAKLDLFGSCE